MITEIDVLTPEECSVLVAYMHTVEANGLWSRIEHPIWHNRVRECIDVGDKNCQKILKKMYSAIQDVLGAYHAEIMQIVKWPTGSYHEEHRDDMYPHRQFGSVAYLNDNYNGGHTYFTDLDIDIVPRGGKVAIFSGDLNHLVTPIENGVRYTVASFWTNDPMYNLYKNW